MRKREHRLGLLMHGALLYVGTIFAADKELLAREYSNLYGSADAKKIKRRIAEGNHGFEVVPLSISRARKHVPHHLYVKPKKRNRNKP